MDKFKLCRYCGCKEINVEKVSTVFSLKCSGCGISTKQFPTKKKAIEFWNNDYDPNPWRKCPDEMPDEHGKYIIFGNIKTLPEPKPEIMEAKYTDHWSREGKIAICYYFKKLPGLPKD